jgi:vacuolar-type H+-ATPase subunit I/STV1
MLVASLSFVTAQAINEEEKSMSLGKQVGYQIDIDGADEDITEDVWKDFMKDFGKTKRNKKAREYYSVGARVPLINGANEIDLYIRFDERVNMTSVVLWVDLGESFVNGDEYPREAQGTEEFLTNFYLAVKKKVIENEMKEQEKIMNKMEKELRKMEKKNSDYHKDIEKAKEKIEKAEKNIEQNLRDQEDQQIIIEQQRKVLEEIIERLNNLGRN